ncbi:MAG: PqqD family protein [Acidobacteriota bacterium]
MSAGLDGLARRPEMEWAEVDNEVVIVNRTGAEVLRLNSVAALVWKQLDGHRSAGDLSQLLCGQFDVAASTAEQDVRAVLRTMLELEVVV